MLVSAILLLVVPAIEFILANQYDYDTGRPKEFRPYAYGFLGAGVLTLLGGFLVASFAREIARDWHAREYLAERRVQVGSAAEALKTGADLSPAEFAAFWQATYDRLAGYHKEAGDQLGSAYRLAQTTSVVGFAVVLPLGLAAAFAKSGGQSLVAGATAVLAGALSAFISGTFRSTYERSLVQRMTYFDEPVLSARLLAAERLLKEFTDTERRDEALLAMVRAAVNAPDSSKRPDPHGSAT